MPTFSLYLNTRGLRTGPGEFFHGVLESPGSFVGNRVGTPVEVVLVEDHCSTCLSEEVPSDNSQHMCVCSSGATGGLEGYGPPRFENMSLAIRPNLHRNRVGWWGN